MCDMPQYLILMYGDEQRWAAQSEQWNQENGERHAAFAVEAGAALLGGAELEPGSTARSLRAGPDGRPVPTDGPFVNTAEGIGGYYLVEAADLDEATRLAALVPEASAPFSGVEVRALRRAD
jgi:hypothetical protein